MKNVPWISADVQACIEPPLIPLIKVELEELHATHIIRVEIQINPSQATPERYKLNISTYHNGKLEELHMLLRNFKVAIDITGTT